LDKRAAAADEASGGNAVEDNSVASGWLGKGCGAHGVRALRLLHRATQGSKQGARGRCGVVIWLTTVIPTHDHEHSSVMCAHCLGCSTFPTIEKIHSHNAVVAARRFPFTPNENLKTCKLRKFENKGAQVF